MNLSSGSKYSSHISLTFSLSYFFFFSFFLAFDTFYFCFIECHVCLARECKLFPIYFLFYYFSSSFLFLSDFLPLVRHIASLLFHFSPPFRLPFCFCFFPNKSRKWNIRRYAITEFSRAGPKKWGKDGKIYTIRSILREKSRFPYAIVSPRYHICEIRANDDVDKRRWWATFSLYSLCVHSTYELLIICCYLNNRWNVLHENKHNTRNWNYMHVNF